MNNIVDLACQVEGADSICYRIMSTIRIQSNLLSFIFLYQELMVRS